ncbi:uncharacterized protein F5891DRAFT_975809 [Suillus fuscotomentosus]|uniref:Uncharacterized protein n=1 Tax=Suillus fuscotomentosus TaxID=1912939 RepID=A0AAD4EGB7_9AGAM|nr:uncharacterized protein F5891DRAFT_975809 [Suillus fuscotomentosus]KAG1905617.1 hypothetical protein F5891DRAFT_975809 [Suillus fuscotomentosus]
MTNANFNFGFPVRQPVTVEVHLQDPAHQTAPTPPQPQKFNFGFAVNKQGPAAADSMASSPSVAPTTFNFGWAQSHSTEKAVVLAGQPLNTQGPAAVDSEPTPPSAPKTFNFGWTWPITTEKLSVLAAQPAPTPPSPAPKTVNFHWTRPITTEMLAVTEAQPEPTPPSPAPPTSNFGWTWSITTEKLVGLAAQPFNFGMDLDGEVPPSPPSPLNGQPIRHNRSSAPDNEMQAPVAEPSSTAGVGTHVGFDHNNKPFKFGCKVPPAKVGEWTLAPITAASPKPSPPLMPVDYTPKALPNFEGEYCTISFNLIV